MKTRAPRDATAASRTHDPSRHQRARSSRAAPVTVKIPTDTDVVTLKFGERSVHLTNLRKPFWREPLITKGDLIQYYADVAPFLLPHLRDLASVVTRYTSRD